MLYSYIHLYTCIAYMIHAYQHIQGRDPVTLSLTKDGLVWDTHFAVRYGAPPVRYPGRAKGVGFQYPGALIDVEKQQMIVSYSIGKEDIGITRFPLGVLAAI